MAMAERTILPSLLDVLSELKLLLARVLGTGLRVDGGTVWCEW
jgi:hypothetical protein